MALNADCISLGLVAPDHIADPCESRSEIVVPVRNSSGKTAYYFKYPFAQSEISFFDNPLSSFPASHFTSG